MARLVAYRSAEWDTPWWDRPNRGPARFNGVLDGPTQYLSSHPLGPFAERLRGLGRESVGDLESVRWRVWVVTFDHESVLDVTFDSAPTVGISADELVGDDWMPCQALAGRLRANGVRGLLVPSAALPGVRNVVLFGPRVASPYLAAPIDDVDMPTAHAAEGSVPPSEVLPLIRWHGDPHAELEAWRARRSFAFVDPLVLR
jgi:RES domain-containing protein